MDYIKTNKTFVGVSEDRPLKIITYINSGLKIFHNEFQSVTVDWSDDRLKELLDFKSFILKKSVLYVVMEMMRVK